MKKEILVLNTNLKKPEEIKIVDYIIETGKFQEVSVAKIVKDMVHRFYNIRDTENPEKFVDSDYFKDSLKTPSLHFSGKTPLDMYKAFAVNIIYNIHGPEFLTNIVVDKIDCSHSQDRFLLTDFDSPDIIRGLLDYYGDQILVCKFISGASSNRRKNRRLFDVEECVSPSGKTRLGTFVIPYGITVEKDFQGRFKRNFKNSFGKELIRKDIKEND